jgi:ATP synthase I chain
VGSDEPGRAGEPGSSGGDPPDPGEPVGISLRPVEQKILLCAGAVLVGIAIAGRFRMLPGALAGGIIAYGNFYLIRKILEKAFLGEGTPGKGFIVQYVLKFLGLVAVVYGVVRSGWFDAAGLLLGLSSLFLGILLEGLARSFKTK